MKATCTVDVTVSLLSVNETLIDLVKIYKERNKRNCLIKPKGVIPYHIWFQIQREVKKLGGKWTRKNRLWIIPLERS
jgi:hypothetical protein